MTITLSRFAQSVGFETAFSVLAVARQLKAAGKRVIELEIGDSPFPSTASAKRAGIAAIEADQSHYCPSLGLPELRAAASRYVNREHRLQTTAACVIVAPGAKPFEQFFCEAVLDAGDGVLVFSPYFPTYLPNILRRGARPVLVPLRQEHEFRPDIAAIEQFLRDDPQPKAIFLNSPHNPTGGVATEDDLRNIADAIRGRNIAVFSDEPYDQMVWRGRHHSLLAQPGMIDQCVAAYTFSKSYSMSGWRLGFAVSSPALIEIMAKLLNTTLSCVPPLVQLAGAAALDYDTAERDSTMQQFRRKVELLTAALNRVPGVKCLDPTATFYAFPSVAAICNRLGITSHGLAMYLLEGADDRLGVACLGGECFGEAGGGFIRFSCAEPDQALIEAVDFFADAVGRGDRLARYLDAHAAYRLAQPYRM
ncbi:MAG TPA: aminotransferase class I/II-fold pyridoxal phosphate-dependent enzyme [Pirellulales bacterium]|jgi:aspartate aminotransferase|nr:aminotransferase class I/II-fold pyridoxal phosphate-dependent enzyme [Pirellulales bacterium]